MNENRVFRITVANITKQLLIAACQYIGLGGGTIFQGTGYAADYEGGAEEYSFTLETVATLSEARRLWARIASECTEDSCYVTVNGGTAQLWYRDNAVFVLSH